MRARRYFAAVDSHTEGMPTRVITGGVGPIPGATMLERKLHFEQHMDDLRLLLMREPRGHGAMSGAILQPPLREDADWGVLFIEVSGLLPMCGHGTIGVATVLVETGHGRGDRAGDGDPARRPRRARRGARRRSRTAARASVTIRNVAVVPARPRPRRGRRRATARSPTTWPTAATSTRSRRPPTRAWWSTRRARTSSSHAGLAVMAAINAADRPVHPEDARISGCHHVVFHEPGRDGADAVAATSIHPGWLDRSPCGTGTSARMAALHARGELALGQPFVNESVIGTRFTGRAGRRDDRRGRARR